MKLGTISAVDNSNGLTLVIDGESSATTKKYHYIASYVPTAGDRVLIEEVGDSYVIVGKVISAQADCIDALIDSKIASSLSTVDAKIDTKIAKLMTGFTVSKDGIRADYKDGTHSNYIAIQQANGVWNKLHDDHTYPIVFYEQNGNFYIAYSGGGTWHKITTS